MKSNKTLRKIIAASMALAMVAGTGISSSVGNIIGTNTVVSAAEVYGDFEYEVNESGTITITKYTGTDQSVVIPDKINNIAVEIIGQDAFYHNNTIRSVTLPNALKEIGYRAFTNCTALGNVTFPSTLETIGAEAFDFCCSMTSLTLPSSVVSVGNYAFRNNDNVRSVSLSSSMTVIPEGCFWSCDSLQTIAIPDSITEIGSHAFRASYGLKTVTFGSGTQLTRIGYSSFEDCVGLTSFTVPNTVDTIDSYAFCNCKSLKTIKLGTGVKTIGYEAFYRCYSLTSLSIPNSVESIAGECFRYCTGLNTVTIGSGIKQIPSSCFANDTALVNVYMGSSVERIEGYAFGYCNQLANFYTVPTNNMYIYHDALLDTKWYAKQPEGAVYFGRVFYNYKGKAENNTTLELKNNTVSISDSALRTTSNITTLTIPKSLTSIDNFANSFNSVTSLKAINVEEGHENYKSVDGVVYSADGKTLIYCPRAKSGAFTIPDEVEVINDGALRDCPKITSLTLGANVHSIDYGDLSSLTGLTSISVSADNPNFVSENGILYNKTKTYLVAYPAAKTSTTYTFPSTVTDMYFYSMTNASKIQTINLNSDVRYFYWWYLNNMTSLTAINVPDDIGIDLSSVDGVLYNKEKTQLFLVPQAKSGAVNIEDTTIRIYSNYTFRNCKNVTSISIPATLTEWGDDYFDTCYGLKEFKVAEGHERLTTDDGLLIRNGNYLICVPKAKTTVTVPSCITNGSVGIRDAAFTNCNSLTTLNIGETLTSFETGYDFVNIPNLTTINVDANNPSLSSVDGVVYDKYDSRIIFVPNGKKGAFTIPSNVASIDGNAFVNCTKLTSITLSDSFSGGFDFYIFDTCTGLTEVNVNSNNDTYVSVSGAVLNKKKTELYYVPKAKTGTYTVPSTVTSVDYRAFVNCGKLTGIVFPDGIKSVVTSLDGCTNLKSVTIPESVDTIERVINSGSAVTIYGYEGSLAEQYSDYYDMQFKKLVSTISLNKTTSTIAAGREVQLKATITPTNVDDGKVTWKSENTKVAAVDSNGKVTGVMAGSTKIVATASDGKTASCIVTVNPSLSNESIISEDNVLLGTQLDVTAIAEGGITSYRYTVDYKLSTADSWTNLLSNSTKTTASFTPASAGTYNVRVTVKDSENYTEEKIFNVKVNEPIKNTSTVSAETTTLGDAVIVKGTSTGGLGDTTYQYQYKLSTASSWTTLSAYSTAVSASFKPSKSGTYNVKVTAKDLAGNTDEKTVDVVVTGTLTNNSTVSATTITAGDKLTVSGIGTGGIGDYSYAYYYKEFTASKWTAVSGFGTKTSVDVTIPNAGYYQICAKVKDANGTTAVKYMNVVVNEKLANNSTLSAEKVTIGGSVTVNAVGDKGMGDYTYAVLYKRENSSSWTTVQNYDKNDKIKITPLAVTNYDVCVKVQDKSGKIEKKYLKLTVNAELANNSTISASSIKIGNTVTVNAKAEGGSGDYTYAVYTKKTSETKWTENQEFSTKTSVSIQPTSAVKYDVCVKVKDSDGTIVKKYLTVDVTKDELKNTSSASAETISLDEVYTVKASATGGTGSYTYAVYTKKTTETKWTENQAFASVSSIGIKFAEAAKYDVCVKVKDSDGTIVKSYLTVEVKLPELKNTSKLSSSSVTLGKSSTVKASATGGTGSYTYAVYTKKSTDTKWTENQAYSTNASVTLTPTEKATYDVCVKVKDSAGTIEKAYLTLTVK